MSLFDKESIIADDARKILKSDPKDTGTIFLVNSVDRKTLGIPRQTCCRDNGKRNTLKILQRYFKDTSKIVGGTANRAPNSSAMEPSYGEYGNTRTRKLPKRRYKDTRKILQRDTLESYPSKRYWNRNEKILEPSWSSMILIGWKDSARRVPRLKKRYLPDTLKDTV